MINHLFKTKEETGLGETTEVVKEVFSNDKSKIYDCPGFNEENFNIFNMQVIEKLCDFDNIYFLYPDSIKKIDEEIKVICAIFDIKNIFFVRTKCDTWKKTDKKTIEEEIDNDIKNLKELGIEIKSEQIFATSEKPKDNNFDNERLEKSLLS